MARVAHVSQLQPAGRVVGVTLGGRLSLAEGDAVPAERLRPPPHRVVKRIVRGRGLIRPLCAYWAIEDHRLIAHQFGAYGRVTGVTDEGGDNHDGLLDDRRAAAPLVLQPRLNQAARPLHLLEIGPDAIERRRVALLPVLAARAAPRRPIAQMREAQPDLVGRSVHVGVPAGAGAGAGLG